MKTVAIYPGSFDPITNGHLDVLRRALSMFDRIIVGIAPNAEKHPLFTTPERLALTRSAVRGLRGVTVDAFDGLLVKYASANRRASSSAGCGRSQILNMNFKWHS